MCWYCGVPITNEEPLGRSLRCHDCGKDLKACKNCRFFLPGSRGDCSETNAESQADKERANFCDWFSLDKKFRNKSEGQPKNHDKAAKARADFDNLFN